MKISEAIELFTSYLLHEKNASERTFINYRLRLGRMQEHLQDKEVESITSMDILEWRKRLWQKGISQKTINYHIIAVRSLFKFLIKNDIHVVDPMKLELSKIRTKEVSYLTDEEVKSLLLAPVVLGWKKYKRDLAILYMLYGSWLRLSELLSLKKADLPTEGNQFQIVGKGGKLRSVFITKEAKKKVNEYLKSRADECEYVFTNKFCEPLGKVSVEKIVKKYATLAGISKKVTPHTLRHSFATSLLKKWADIRSVQMLLGHSSITTTQVYTHVSDTQLEKAHDLLN